MIRTSLVAECDRCQKQEVREQSGRCRKTALVRELRGQGWRVGRKRSLCPACVEEEAAERGELRYEEELAASEWYWANVHSRRFQVSYEDTYPMLIYFYNSLPYARRRARAKSFEHPGESIWVYDTQTERYLGRYRDGQWIPE